MMPQEPVLHSAERQVCELRVLLRGGGSREERIGEFDGESGFAYLLRVGCAEAHKLSPNVVDDEQVAVWAVVHTENFIRRSISSINAMQHCYILIAWLDRPQFHLLESR